MPKIDKSQLRFGVPRRVREDKHRSFINRLPCAVCGSQPPNECAHISAAGGKGMGLKVSDEYTLPLCREHHARAHQIGERSFFVDIENAIHTASQLYENTGDITAALGILREFRKNHF